MTTATGHATRTRSVIMKFPGGDSAIATPGPSAPRKLTVGMWAVFLSVLLLSQGYGWAVSPFVVAALPFWVGRDILQSSARS